MKEVYGVSADIIKPFYSWGITQTGDTMTISETDVRDVSLSTLFGCVLLSFCFMLYSGKVHPSKQISI